MRSLRVAAGVALVAMILSAPVWPRARAGWYRTITVFGHVVPLYRIDCGDAE